MKNYKNIIKFLALTWNTSKKASIFNLFFIIVNTVTPLLNIILSANIINQLIINENMRDIIISVAALILSNLILAIMSAYLKRTSTILTMELKDKLSQSVGLKTMQMDYINTEDANILDLQQKALIPILEYRIFEFVFNKSLPVIIGSLITILTTVIVAARHSIILLLPVIFVVVINLFLSKIRDNNFMKIVQNAAVIERKIGYYDQVANDITNGKDIRVFSMDNIIMRKIKEFNEQEYREFAKIFNVGLKVNVTQTFLLQLLTYIIYFYVAYSVYMGNINIGEFFVITGLFIKIGMSASDLLNTIVQLKSRDNIFEKFFAFLDIPSKVYDNTEFEEESCGVTLKNISFHYPNSEKNILENINLDIPPGYKVAVVGENGSGKTTLAKIICGLIKPSSGEIALDDVMPENNIELASVVFQDFKLFSFPVIENIRTSFDNNKDFNKLADRVGLTDRIEQMPEKENTYLYKNFEPAGVELSGGQGQKLAIIRALYKKSKLIILDEPTGSLDAKTESEIFENFRDVTKDKTAILISHRLYSCKFCDMIIMLENGKIIEQGNHDTLMKQNGKYYKMFEAQAHYYLENNENSEFRVH